MKNFIILILLCSTALALEDYDGFYSMEDLLKEDFSDVIEAEIEDDQKWLVPQFDGSLKWMTEQEAKDQTLNTEIIEQIKWVVNHFKNKRRKVRFLLFTQKNPAKWQEIDMERPETLERSNFNASHPTR